jgi:hypothetical protein
MIAVNTCADMPWTCALPEEFASVLCHDPAWDRDAALETVRRFTTSFLLDTLTGDERARELLSQEVVEQRDVRYHASW